MKLILLIVGLIGLSIYWYVIDKIKKDDEKDN